jgi:hypothetical protein
MQAPGNMEHTSHLLYKSAGSERGTVKGTFTPHTLPQQLDMATLTAKLDATNRCDERPETSIELLREQLEGIVERNINLLQSSNRLVQELTTENKRLEELEGAMRSSLCGSVQWQMQPKCSWALWGDAIEGPASMDKLTK